jgi:predicted nucleic acid-binding protein
MRSALFDSSIYISALRRGDDAAVALTRLSEGVPVWLSAVVLEELLAGAIADEVHSIDRLERDFVKLKRILVPTLGDWCEAGRMLSRLAAKYHHEAIGRARLTNDALIATSAARLGITVVTENPRDFQRLAEFRRFEWRVAAF